MSVEITHNFDLSHHSTLRIGGVGKVLYTVTDPEHDLKEIFQEIKKEQLSWTILGEGSNSVFSDGFHDMAFIKLQASHNFSPQKDLPLTPSEGRGNLQTDFLQNSNEGKPLSFGGGEPKAGGGLSVISERRESMYIFVPASMSWDYLVEETMRLGLTGLEALSAIPGTVGAAPVQNIGAYGAQFSDRCESVRVFNTETLEIEILAKESCKFAYRSSIFKTEKKYIVLGVTLFLFKTTDHPDVPDYKDVREYFEKREVVGPSSGYIRKAIVEIRWGKLPKPTELPNCGSFFKNAEITREHADTLLKEYPEMPVYEIDPPSLHYGETVKTSTGWLIEQVGLKGHRIGDVGIYERHALVMVNYGKGTFAELESLVQLVQGKVKEKFGIIVEPEVNIFV